MMAFRIIMLMVEIMVCPEDCLGMNIKKIYEYTLSKKEEK